MITLPQTKIEQKASQVEASVKDSKEKRKRSALEISDAIGVYGAFGRTLSELHKQGR